MPSWRGCTAPMKTARCAPLSSGALDPLQTAAMNEPGRNCPLHYRYARAPSPGRERRCEVLYVVGGLYGNEQALERVLELFDARARRQAARVQRRLPLVRRRRRRRSRRSSAACSRFSATRGNVETELAAPQSHDGATPAAAAPIPTGWVTTSSRARTVSSRGCATPRAHCLARATRCSPCRCGCASTSGGARVGDRARRRAVARRLGLRAGAPARRGGTARRRGGSRRRKSTCSPAATLACRCSHAVSAIAASLLNNGAAGMPNFAGAPEGLLTRIAMRPFEGPQRRFGTTATSLYLDAHRDRLRRVRAGNAAFSHNGRRAAPRMRRTAAHRATARTTR